MRTSGRSHIQSKAKNNGEVIQLGSTKGSSRPYRIYSAFGVSPTLYFTHYGQSPIVHVPLNQDKDNDN